jgi:hypothetical protein
VTGLAKPAETEEVSALTKVRALKAKQAAVAFGSDSQKAKRMARFNKESHLMETKFAKPKRAFAHAGGSIKSNKDEALQKFIDRKYLGDGGCKPPAYDE